MFPGKLKTLFTLGALVLTAGAAGTAHADPDFPTRAVRIISPFSPGGATDVLARVLAHHLNEKWQQSVVVENRAGAGGVIAAQAVARSTPDGYTLLLGSVGPMEVLPSLIKDLPYDPIKDFSPISMLVDVENVLVVNNAVPAKSVQELLALIKQKPGALHFGSSGIGTTGHLAGEVFKQQAGLDMVHVPYKGGAPAANALLAGDVEMSFATVPSVVGHVRSGKLRALAVTGAKPLSALPGVQPLKDQGVPNYAVASWYGLLAPANTPKDVVAKIHQDVQEILAMPKVQATLLEQGWTTVHASTEFMAEQIRKGIPHWRDILEKAGVRVE